MTLVAFVAVGTLCFIFGVSVSIALFVGAMTKVNKTPAMPEEKPENNPSMNLSDPIDFVDSDIKVDLN